jgi:glycosyltransferase involved in cell wall biosynthesis
VRSVSSIVEVAGEAAAVPRARRASPRVARPLRVLLVVESSGGGTGRHVLDLAEAFVARGVDVHLIYSPPRADAIFLERVKAIAGLRATQVAMRTAPHPGDLGVVWRVRRYMKAWGPFDLIHGHSSKGGAIARLAALGTRTGAVYTLHGLIMMDPGLPRWKWLFYLSIELTLSLRTRRIIAVSPEESRGAVRVGLGSSRVVTIPNGIGVMRVTPREAARRAMGVPPGAIVVGYVGRLVDQKAPDVLIRAFAAAANKVPSLRLAMVGAGPLDEPMRELSRALGVAERVVWLGERDARDVFAGFDMFALSSRKEGLPYVVLEALVMGLPVVATSSAGVELLVTTGENGAVVAPGDDVAFGRALAETAADRERMRRYGVVSRERAARLTVGAMAERTLAVYVQCLAPARAAEVGTALS